VLQQSNQIVRALVQDLILLFDFLQRVVSDVLRVQLLVDPLHHSQLRYPSHLTRPWSIGQAVESVECRIAWGEGGRGPGHLGPQSSGDQKQGGVQRGTMHGTYQTLLPRPR